jgi:hypothetical protein
VEQLDEAGCINGNVDGLEIERKVIRNLGSTSYARGGYGLEDRKGIASRSVTEVGPFLDRPSGAPNVVDGIAEFGEDSRVEAAGLYEFFESVQLTGGRLQPS